MATYTKAIILGSLRLVFIGALFVPVPLLAATISVSSSATYVQAGDLVSVRILINPQGTAINNAEGVLHFPASTLEVLSITRAGSVFPLWIEDPSFSNTAGTVTFNGGVPNPGTRDPGTALTISFQARKSGVATLFLSDAAIRANDGLGTNVISGSSGAEIVVTEPAAVTAPVVVPVKPTTPTPSKPSTTVTPSSETPLHLESVTHPDPTKWYTSTRAEFKWELPEGVTAVELGMSRGANDPPSVSYAKAITEKTIEDLEDGIWYFRLRYRTREGWSEISEATIRVDAHAPEIVSQNFFYDNSEGALLIDISGKDTGSGIAHYEISIDGEPPLEVDADAFAGKPYALPFTESGLHRIVLTAVDAAGNTTSAEGSFSVPPSLIGQTLFRIGSFEVRVWAAFLAMALFSLLTLGIAVFERLALARRTHRRVLPRTIRKKMHADFLRMKEAIGRDIQALEEVRSRRDLTRQEAALYRRLMKNVETVEKNMDSQLRDQE